MIQIATMLAALTLSLGEAQAQFEATMPVTKPQPLTTQIVGRPTLGATPNVTATIGPNAVAPVNPLQPEKQESGPLVYQQYVQRPNLGGDQSRGDTNAHILRKVLPLLRSAPGAPKVSVRSQQFRDWAGGKIQFYKTPDLTGEILKYQLTKDPKTASELRGLDCGKNPRNRLVCMVCNIYFEAANEPSEGKLAVGGSVMTRVYNENFPGTTCEVIYQKNKSGVAQYSWTVEPKPHKLPTDSMSTLQAVFDAAVQSLRKGPTGYSNYYAPTGMKPPGRRPDWAMGGNCAATLVDIGSQKFCKLDSTVTRTTAQVMQFEGLNAYAGASPNRQNESTSSAR